jgi:hypothetical protein
VQVGTATPNFIFATVATDTLYSLTDEGSNGNSAFHHSETSRRQF